MDSLKVLAVMLHYPNQEQQAAADELIAVLDKEAIIGGTLYDRIVAFIRRQAQADLLEIQEAYVNTFDKGRARSLYLFEHVHGESRDRGQAMVDLRQQYLAAGYEISSAELPDYVPMFLEFCAQLSAPQAIQWLEDVGHLLALLYTRLQKHESPYAVLLEPLLILAGQPLHNQDMAQQVAAEPADDTPEALDEVWMEDPVTFGADDACDQFQGLTINKSGDHPFKVLKKRQSESLGG